MTRFLLGALLATSLFSATTYAAEFHVVVVVNDPKTLHVKLVDAATRACQEAIARDAFGDYGTRDECVDNSVHDAMAKLRTK